MLVNTSSEFESDPTNFTPVPVFVLIYIGLFAVSAVLGVAGNILVEKTNLLLISDLIFIFLFDLDNYRNFGQ